MATFFLTPDFDIELQQDLWDVATFCTLGLANTAQAAPPFRVLFVTPVGSNTLRVFLASEPRHYSTLSLDDALFRDNWSISVLSGPGLVPVVERVENAQARPNEFPTIPGAWSIDLRTNTRVLTNTTYLTVASPNLVSAFGAPMAAAPDDRDDHPGIAVIRPRRPQRSLQVTPSDSRKDLHYDTLRGIWILDSKSDIALHDGLDALKKRVIRRLISVLGGFYHLPEYGANLKAKELFNATKLSLIRRDALDQIRREEEVRKVSVLATSPASGVLVLNVSITASFGTVNFDLGRDVEQDQFFVV